MSKSCRHPSFFPIRLLDGPIRGWQCMHCRALVTVGDKMTLDRLDDLQLSVSLINQRLDALMSKLEESEPTEE